MNSYDLGQILEKNNFVTELESGAVTINPSIVGQQAGEYKIVGQMFATMLLQEGPPLTIFCPSLATYLTTGTTEGIEPAIMDIYDGHVRRALQQVIHHN